MTIHTAEVVYPTHQLSVPYLFKLKLLFTSKCTSYTHIAHHPLRIEVCHTMNITSE
ncbi:hypothetical protein F383_20725 [Gossypium arboreum]|uniref:Uncharacterized protein n=1 Tax=Gossypium arboreum TaxID=29729 RepID=A0A0B0NVT8_GOSAR|nr:hypothetical protein F383_20725 [Gossypium arboreum]